MKEVRQLEKDIVDYQDELRQNIQEKQLTEYNKIGDDKLKEFFEKWEKLKSESESESFRKMEDLK